MFTRSVIVAGCTSSQQRKLAGDLVARLIEKMTWWLAQTEDSQRELSVESQLQQLWGINVVAATEFCAEIEQAIVESALLEQLGRTAYASLRAVGYDCSSFEWVMEV